ncbi:hypothetical protein JCM10213_002697, partial [Rhodosporidiobolus nylandii]
AAFSFTLYQLTQSQGEYSLIQPPWAPLLPHPFSCTLYRPFLRHMTLCDDAWELRLGGGSGADGAGSAGGGGVGKKTRRSARGKKESAYDRKLPWQSASEAEWLRRSGFEEGETVSVGGGEGGEEKQAEGEGGEGE